jgi:hypothetical protein
MQTALQMKQRRDTRAEKCVKDAVKWTPALVERERELIRQGIVTARNAKGEPDPVLALARKLACAPTTIASLLYRPPKVVAADVYLGLAELYEAECERQISKYASERAEVRTRTRLGTLMVSAADRLVGSIAPEGRRPLGEDEGDRS